MRWEINIAPGREIELQDNSDNVSTWVEEKKLLTKENLSGKLEEKLFPGSFLVIQKG